MFASAIRRPPEQSIFLTSTWWPRLAIGGLVAVSAICLLAGAGATLRILYPTMALVVGVFLIFTSKPTYTSFTWWLWFLSPFLRRLIDYQSGWVDPSPVLLAPLLVTLVSGVELLRRPFLLAREAAGFFICLVAVSYGVCVALVQRIPLIAIAIPLMSWLAPLVYGFYLFSNWHDYPAFRDSLKRTFFWGALVMGAYGVFQFLVGPPWDLAWMLNVAQGSFGAPEAMGIRVFSTMNAPQTYAVIVMASLLLLVVTGGPLRFPIAVVAYLSFLLTSSRGAWLGWSVGIVVLMLCSPVARSIRIVLLLIGASAFLVPVILSTPAADVIVVRLQTIGEGRNDVSYAARVEGYDRMLRDAFGKPFGGGIGIMDRD